MICNPQHILFGLYNSRRMRWASYVARREEGRGVYRVWVGRPEWTNHLEELSVNESISSRSGLGTWTELIWPGTGTAGSCHCSNK
jgi:hypothetical protein